MTWNLVDTSAALRDAWRAGRPTFGGWATLGDPYAAELLGRAGFDWVGLDVQHGLIPPSAVPELLRALAVTSTPALVRVSWNAPEEIMRVLDAGANGVIVPLVNSAEEARAAVAACRYPPDGTRSWGPARAALGTPGYDVPTANAAVICAVMAETAAAVERIDEIASVPGVDAVFIGPRDLALSYGEDMERLERGVAAVRDACRRAGIVPGIYAPTGAAEATRRARDGFRLVGLTADATLLTQAAAALLAGIRPDGGVG